MLRVYENLKMNSTELITWAYILRKPSPNPCINNSAIFLNVFKLLLWLSNFILKLAKDPQRAINYDL